MDSLEKFVVYRKAVELLALITQIVDVLPRGNATLLDQLRRSSLSIPLNIAEGAGKMSLRDRQRYFSIARGSAFETYAILDACKVMKLVDSLLLVKGQGLLTEIVAMLTSLTGQAKLFKSNRLSENSLAKSLKL